MATEIKRVRFFDGQFLKELEFRDEQAYHMHLRRRMNYFLFGESGVVQVGANDLKFININVANKTFQVQAGMAICRRTATQEGKEVVLFLDSAPIDLDNEGIIAGGTAFIALHWDEEEIKDPASEGDVDENTRVREKAVITVHTAAPPALAANGEENILLGTLTYNTMAASYAGRQEAKIRASLVTSVAPPTPTLTGINVHTGAPGASVSAVITGTNLAGASAVAFSGTGVTATIEAGATAVSIPVTIAIAGAAATGPRTFTVTAAAGSVSSLGVPGADFTITAVVPTVSLISVQPSLQATGGVVDIHGNNIRNPALGVGVAATGTTVLLRKAANTKAVPTVTVRPDVAGHQVVRVTIPDRTGTPWLPKEAVTLDLTFNASTGSLAFGYDD